jgi:DNA-binding transcriptional ArsR family regulator
VRTTATRADSAASQLDFVSPQLAAAMSHPTRVHAMSILGEHPASPRQLAKAMDEPLNNVTYHVNQLRELGCIELDRTERRGGGRVLEHFYRTTRRAYFDEDAWEVLSAKERLGVIGAVLRMISKDIAAAMASGTFYAEDEKHVSRSPIAVDTEGWDEIGELLERTTDELFEIEERVGRRSEQPSIHAKVEILQFRSPPPGTEVRRSG